MASLNGERALGWGVVGANLLLSNKDRFSRALATSRLRMGPGGTVDPHRVIEAGFVQRSSHEMAHGNGLDLRLERVYEINGSLTLGVDTRELPEYRCLSSKSGWYELRPGRAYQLEFQEQLTLPSWLCGVTLVRSTMGKSGCGGENGLYDSGYCGGTGMMVTVQHVAHLEQGAPVVQMLFMRSAKVRPYQGVYQGTYTPEEWS